MRVGPIGTNRRGDLVIAHGHHTGRTAVNNGQRIRIGNANGHAIGVSVRIRNFNDMPRFIGQRVGRRAGALHAHDLGCQPQQIPRQYRPTNAGAKADRDVKHIQGRRRAKQFQRPTGHANHQIGVSRRREFQPLPSASFAGHAPSRHRNPRHAQSAWRQAPAWPRSFPRYCPWEPQS